MRGDQGGISTEDDLVCCCCHQKYHRLDMSTGEMCSPEVLEAEAKVLG